MPAEPFEPDGVAWRRVSPRLVAARLVPALAVLLLLTAAVVVAGVLTTAWVLVGAALPVGLAVLLLVVVPRQVRAWGYAEREDDLLVRRGVLVRSLVVVPYGRLQYVDVTAGPLDRLLGLSTLQLHTASASTDAAIPGLVAEEASRLRDRLAARGEARLAGL